MVIYQTKEKLLMYGYPDRYIGNILCVLSLTMEYALRASVFLAERPNASHTVHQIAAETQAPSEYLSKVMRDLSRADIVRSRPGRNGGYALDREPGTIALFDVIEAVEPIRVIVACPLNKPCHSKELCPLHRSLRAATEVFLTSLRLTTLADLCPAVGASATKMLGAKK